MGAYSPWYVDALLYAIYALFALAAGLAVWSLVHGHRQGSNQALQHWMPAKRIAWGVVALLVLTLLATFVLASTRPEHVNGREFTDALWLRLSDMLINSSLVLLAVTVICVVFSVIRSRKESD